MGDIPYLPALEKARTRYVVRWLNRKKFARTGVPCFQCGSYATIFNQRNIICSICQASLTKSDYLSVAIDNYAVVHWDQPLDSVSINQLLEDNFSILTIIHNLNTHYALKYRGRPNLYLNPFTDWVEDNHRIR